MSYKCNSCNHIQSKFFGICPKCKDGIGEEFEDTKISSNSSNKQLGDVSPNYIKGSVLSKIKQIDKFEEKQEACFVTKYKNFNSVIGSAKGFVKGQVTLLGASPGVGKSTLCISIADENTLYISSEENFSQVNSRALRVNPNSNCDILNTTSIDEVLDAIIMTDKEFIIIDSLNSIEFGVGYLTVAKYAHEITKTIKDYNKTAIIISQVSRTGEITGMNSIVHVVDTVLHLERSEVSSNIIATSSKNRYGEIGAVAVFKHAKNGFEEVDVDHMIEKPEIGATYTETRFGHKNMTISIESLVADSQSSFGLRKSNGYNQNRLIQIIGILSYFGKMKLTDKDIYVAISNGLSTDDIGIELAMANSILSSFYSKTIVKHAYGEIRLNGKVVNGIIDGNEIKDIKELINLYK